MDAAELEGYLVLGKSHSTVVPLTRRRQKKCSLHLILKEQCRKLSLLDFRQK